MEGIKFSGRMSDLDFLSRLNDLKTLPSNDARFNNAYDDIWQHTENNPDFQGNRAFDDNRLLSENSDDEVFLNFICEMAHPLVRPNVQEALRILVVTNDWLKEEGWELYSSKEIAGGNILSFRSMTAIQKPSEEEISHIWDQSKLRLFISHRDEHKLAGKNLSDDLAQSGISGFVAHEDIAQQSPWRQEILKALCSSS